MPSQDTKMLEFNAQQKSDRASFIIYVDLECLIEKTDGHKNSPKNSWRCLVGKYHQYISVLINFSK